MEYTGIVKDLTFEDFKHKNGITYWLASEFALMLGYPNFQSFKNVIDRAIKAFISLGIDQYDNIIRIDKEVDGKQLYDFKLTRFACYIIAMNADPKKTEVAKAQAYFAIQTQRFEESCKQNESIERLIIRDEIKEGNKSLSSTIKVSGIESYEKFNNAGYVGMYNMFNVQLAKKRGVSSKKIFETMGRAELAANLFRITQTEERIKFQQVKGQSNLENVHFQVGKEVRKIVKRSTGTNPENLPQVVSLAEAKKSIKKDFKEIKKIDKK